jgi:hypothetical protein
MAVSDLRDSPVSVLLNHRCRFIHPAGEPVPDLTETQKWIPSAEAYAKQRSRQQQGLAELNKNTLARLLDARSRVKVFPDAR